MTTKAIIEKLQALNINRVAVFDDEIELLENIWSEDSDWESIFTTYEEFLELELGPTQVDEMRRLKADEERLNALEIIKQHVGQEDLLALKSEAKTAKLVRLWVERLKEFGLDIDTFIDFDDFKRKTEEIGIEYKLRLGQYDLILLDFHFITQPNNHSELIAKEISDLLDPSNRENTVGPPILVRFSSLNLKDYSEDEKRRFVHHIGFARGCYDFLRKDLVLEELGFTNKLLKIIDNAEHGRPLYVLSRNVAQAISQKAATDVMRTLYKLAPESINIIAEHRLQLEGVTTLDYFTKLFLGLLNHNLSGSKEVITATKAFLDSITVDLQPTSAFDHEGLDLVQNNLLFDYKINEFRKPINFGDIFLFSEELPDKVGILITQACDMAIRGQKASQALEESSENSKPNLPKVEYVTLLTGTIVPLSSTSSNGANSVTKYFSVSPETSCYCAINWNLKKTISLPRALIDLVSLNVEGKVVLPLSDDLVECEWWSKAYEKYINWVCKYLRQNHFYVGEKSSIQNRLEVLNVIIQEESQDAADTLVIEKAEEGEENNSKQETIGEPQKVSEFLVLEETEGDCQVNSEIEEEPVRLVL